MEVPPRTRLSFPRLLNARDLGGYPLTGGGVTRSRSLLRTDDLWRLTPEGTQALLDYGLSAVIDLRWPEERDARPSVFQRGLDGVRYTPLSLLGSSEREWQERSPVVPKEKWSCINLDLCGREIAATLRAVVEAPPGVVAFHCMAGKDRTGTVAQLLLAIAGAEPDAIAEDYALSTEYIREPYLAARPRETWDAVLEEIRCPPEQVRLMLAYLDERWGGVTGYLASVGMSNDEVSAVRARLVDATG